MGTDTFNDWRRGDRVARLNMRLVAAGLAGSYFAAVLLAACAHVNRSEWVFEVAGYKGTRLCLIAEDADLRKDDRHNGRNFCYKLDSKFTTEFRRGDCIKAWVPSPGQLPDTTARSITKLERSCEIGASEFSELADALLQSSAST
jgi:hypothetical protein